MGWNCLIEPIPSLADDLEHYLKRWISAVHIPIRILIYIKQEYMYLYFNQLSLLYPHIQPEHNYLLQ